ncbi:MAG: ABC transporter substrate-binding protein [Synergistaceae bacterium]|jgi:peptide/nickel transport system substrate-binding protein|nr:ABC transporter substrate-binding protein [Synergistaceae bacterium]
MKKIVLSRLFLALAVMASLIFAPCGTAAAAKRTDLNLCVPQAFRAFDPHYNTLIVEKVVTSQIFEPLYFTDDNAVSHPILAESHEVTPDNLTYTFRLRKGVTFHNGEELKAEDVVFSFENAMKSPYMLLYVDSIDAISKVDDYTVAIKLKYANAPFVTGLNNIGIVNKKQYEAAGKDVGDRPCGTGPYKFESHQLNVGAVLKKYDGYWGTPASIETLNWKVILDMSTELIALEAGELDILDVPTPNWKSIVAQDKWVTIDRPYTHVSYVEYNHEKAPFDNKLVRQAINYAINKEDVIIMARDGLGEATYTMAKSPYVFGATTDCPKYDYDPEKAKALLAEAGYPDGFDAGPILTVGGTYFEKIAQVLMANLADIGVTSTIEARETASWISDTSAGNYRIAIMGRTTEPDFSFFDIVYGSQYIGSTNQARYSNPRVDELFVLGKGTLDREKRKEYYKELIDTVQDDAVYAPLFFRTMPLAHDKKLNYKYYLNVVKYVECSWNE